MTASLKGVCVGTGYFSQFHLEAWNRIDDVHLAAVCDASSEKAEESAQQFSVPKVYRAEEFAEMLDVERPDFVDIITPPATHLDLCQEALNRGIAVICQKPLAPTYSETLALAAMARRSGSRFMVHENWRWQPWYRELKRLLEDGTLGEFYHFSMKTRLGDGWGKDAYLDRQPFFRDYPRLFIFETGVHFLDTFRFLFGEVASLYARTARRNPVIQGEDSALLLCNFSQGGTALLDANRYNEGESANPRYTFGSFRAEGSRGHVEMDDTGAMRIKALGEPASDHLYPHGQRSFGGDCVHALQSHFVAALRNGTAFESDIDDYLRSVQLVEQAYVSAEENRVVSIDSGIL